MSRKTFFDHFVSKNSLRIPRKGRDPVLGDLYNNAKAINLKRVDRIQAKFDPLYPNVASIREMLTFLHSPKAKKTNEECLIRTTITTDRQEPELKFFLKNDKKLVYQTGLLQTIDILYHLNDYMQKLEAEFEEK